MTYPAPNDTRVIAVMKQFGFDEFTARRHVRDRDEVARKLKYNGGRW